MLKTSYCGVVFCCSLIWFVLYRLWPLESVIADGVKGVGKLKRFCTDEG